MVFTNIRRKKMKIKNVTAARMELNSACDILEDVLGDYEEVSDAMDKINACIDYLWRFEKKLEKQKKKRMWFEFPKGSDERAMERAKQLQDFCPDFDALEEICDFANDMRNKISISILIDEILEEREKNEK